MSRRVFVPLIITAAGVLFVLLILPSWAGASYFLRSGESPVLDGAVSENSHGTLTAGSRQDLGVTSPVGEPDSQPSSGGVTVRVTIAPVTRVMPDGSVRSNIPVSAPRESGIVSLMPR